MKNIINEIPSRTTSTAVWKGTIFDAPADGSRTNIARPDNFGETLIPNNTNGYGVYLNMLNDALANQTENIIIEDDDGDPLAVTRRRYSGQKDKDYLDIFMDEEYEGGCLKIHVKRRCWLNIEGVICTTGPGGTTTQSTGVGIKRHNGVAWINPIIGASSYANEPGADGLALGLSSLHYYPAGTTLKIVIMTTHDIHTRMVEVGSGTMGIISYIAITRMSTEY